MGFAKGGTSIMKIITILSLLLLASPAFGELTKEDLQAVIKEEITASEKRMEKYIKEEIAASEKRMREYIDLKINALDENLSTKIGELDKRLSGRIGELDKRLSGRIDDLQLFMIALIGLIAAAIAIPQIVVVYRDRGQKELRTEVERLRKEVEAIGNTSI